MAPTYLYRTSRGLVSEREGRRRRLPAEADWDSIVSAPASLDALIDAGADEAGDLLDLLAPIVSQEVWAAGVTYLRSRDERVRESEASGSGDAGGDVYRRVYDADRPELFFKATPHRVVGPGGAVRIRSDSRWNVPEPELALLVSPAGRVIGYTIGNDMSSRDIEGANPLYLPQAKVYDGCCALGPGVMLASASPPPATEISMRVTRGGREAFAGATSLSRMKRSFDELVQYLFRDNSFPRGCYLLTGAGVIPPADFTLQSGDEIAITIDPIGTLRNRVE